MSNKTEFIANIISEFIYNLKWENLSKEIHEKINTHILDTFGVMLRGSTYPVSNMIFNGVLGSTSEDSSGEATIVGKKTTGPMLIAALLNGTSAHGLEFDDGYTGIHPGAPVVASALAAAELTDATGEEFMCAVVGGYEIAIRVNRAVFPGHRRKGFHPTGTCATFVAAVAAGKILGLTTDEIANALGLAGTQVAGLREGSGKPSGMTKRLHAGKAAENGLLSALIAKEGYLAAHSIFEGKSGFLNLYCDDPKANLIVEKLGEIFHFTDCYLKPYPTCRHLHGPIESTLKLRDEYSFKLDEIKEIIVKIYREGTYACFSEQNPNDFYDAQFSIPYAIAVALKDGEVTLNQFTENEISDSEVQKLCKKVNIVFDDNLDEEFRKNRIRAHVVNIYLSNGKHIYKRIEYPKGSSQNPLTREEVINKFKNLVIPVLKEDRTMNLLELFKKLSDLESLKDICYLLGHFN